MQGGERIWQINQKVVKEAAKAGEKVKTGGI